MAKKPPVALVPSDVDKPREEPRDYIPGRNGGRLRRGGTNKGGPGRPPSVVRELCLGSFADRMEVLRDIADGEPVVKVLGMDGKTVVGTVSASPGDRIKALDVLAKYGLGTKTETEVTGGQTFEIVVRDEIPHPRRIG